MAEDDKRFVVAETFAVAWRRLDDLPEADREILGLHPWEGLTAEQIATRPATAGRDLR